MDLQPFLQNEIVSLKPLTENDFEDVFSIASDPLIWEQHPTKDRYKREVFQLYFDGAVKSKGAFLVYDKQSEKLIGCTRYYDYKPDESSVAIGYTFLVRNFWGGPHNRAMKHLLLNHAFRFVDRVYFHVGANNIRSQKAVLKLGAKKVRDVDFDYYGSPLLHFEYVMDKDS